MTHPLSPLVLSCSLALAPSSSSPTAVPQEPRDSGGDASRQKSYYPTYVVVDTHALLEDQEVELVAKVDKFLSERAPGLLRGLVPLESKPAQGVAKLRIALSWADYDNFRYRIALTAERPDGTTREETLELQGDEYIVLEHLEDKVPVFLEWLEKAPESPNRTRTATPPETEHHPRPPKQPAKPQERRLSGLGWTGVGFGVLGLGALVTGIALLIPTDTDFEGNPDDGIRRRPQRRYSPTLSIGLMLGGGAFLSLGATLLGVDLNRSKNKNKNKRSAVLTPNVSTDGLGLSLSGRF